MDTADDVFFLLKHRGLGSDKTEDDFFVRGHFGKRGETTGAGIVVFEIESIDIFFCEDIIGYSIIGAAGEISGVVVTTADMRGDCHVCRAVFKCKIVYGKKLLFYFVQINTKQVIAMFCGIAAKGAPGTIVELEVPAAGIVELADNILVSNSDIVDQVVKIRVIFPGGFQVVRTIICWKV